MPNSKQISTSMTDKKQYERVLLGNLLSVSPDAIIVIDENQSVLIFNKGAETIFGYSANEILGHSIHFLLPTRMRTLHKEHIKSFADGSQVNRLKITGAEILGLRKDGSEFPAEATISKYESAGTQHLLIILRDITERKHAEKVRRRSEERLATAIECMPDGFALFDADDRLVLCNERYRETYPRHADRLVLGERFEDMLRGGVYAGEFREVVGREEEWIAERMRMHLDPTGPIEQRLGDGRWLRVEERRTREGGIVGLRTDITKIKQAERNAAEAKSLLTDAIESVSEAFALYDSGDRLVLCNEKFRQIHPWAADICVPGTTFEELARSGAEAGMYPEANGRLEEWLRQRLAEHHDVTGTYVRRLTDGRWLQIRNRRTSDGGIVGIRMDITERKRAEEAIEKSAEQFRAVVDNSPTAILLKDLDGRFLIINKRFEEWYGLRRTEAFGRTSHDLYSTEDAEKLADQDQHVLDTLRVAEREYDIKFADGEFHTVIVTKFPVLDGTGKPIGIGSVTSDVTRQRRTEAQLRQSQKMQALGQLTGGIAHDFNNLLAIIHGNAELISEQQTDDTAALIRPLMRATRRGAELTHRLLAFSRQQSLRPQAINVAALVHGIYDMLNRTLGEIVDIETTVEPGGWDIWADSGQLENALLNLAINARDAMPQGGRLTIACANARLGATDLTYESEGPVGEYVTLAVNDTGVGMSAEVRTQAFDPFFTTKDASQGTGLGLSMVYGFAKQSGGYAAIDSTEGQGTTVTLYLPKARGTQAVRNVETDRNTPRGGSETVLVIEDYDDVRVLAVQMLKGLNYEVIGVVDAAAARTVIHNGQHIDLILSDVMLPGGTSGPAFAEEIRARNPDVKFVFMSGYTAEASKHHVPLTPDAVLLHKPFRKQLLAKVVREALDS